MEVGRLLLWVALAISAVAPRESAAEEPASDAAQGALLKLEVLARILPDGPDLSQGVDGLQRTLAAAAGDARFNVEGLATRALDPVVSGDTGYVPVDFRAVLRSRGPRAEGNGHGTAPWRLLERCLRRSTRVAIFEQFAFHAEEDGSLRFSGLLRLHFWPQRMTVFEARTLLSAKMSAIEALDAQRWWPLRRLARLDHAPVTDPRRELSYFLTNLSVTRTEVSAEGIAPWPVSARDWWPGRDLIVSSCEWSQQGSCQRFSVKARFPKHPRPRMGGAAPDSGPEPPLDGPPKDLALLLARPDDVCPIDEPSSRRFPFVKASGNGPLTLFARDLDVLDVVLILHRMAGKFVVVDEGVSGRVSVDFVGVTLEQALAALNPFGVSASPPALVRHVSFGTPPLDLTLPSGKEAPVSFWFKRGAFVDVLRLLEDFTGDRILIPTGPLPRISVYAQDLPFDTVYGAVLRSAGLSLRREPGLIFVERTGHPSQYAALPPQAGRPLRFDFGEVSGDQMEHRALSLTAGGAWTAWMVTPQGFLHDFKEGTRLFDGVVRSVGEKGALIEIELTDPLSSVRSRTRSLDLPPAQ
jgi:hypothetical protein